MNKNFQRIQFRHDPRSQKHDLAIARDLFKKTEYRKAFDLYEQLLSLYPNAEVEILAEVCDH